MTSAETVWSASQHALWQRLEQHDFGTAGHRLGFTARLAREHGWSEAYAAGAVREYKRFCFLAMVSGHAVTPSDAVDEAWHLHLTYSRDYWTRYCPEVLGGNLHHEPSRGGHEQAGLHYEQYAQTLASYQRWFGPPPLDYWPDAHTQTASPARYRRIDLSRHWLLRRPRLPRPRWSQLGLAGLLLGAAPLLQALPLNPLDMSGPSFLMLFLVLLIVSFAVLPLLRRQLRDTGPGQAGSELDEWSLAYLAGGSVRVVETGIAQLLADGKAQWNRKKRTLEFSGSHSGLEFPLNHIAANVGQNVDAMARKIDRYLKDVHAGLLRRGLLLQPERRRRVGLVSALPFGLLTLLGVAKIWVGITRDRPVLFLIFLTAICVIAGLIVLFSVPERSRAGDALLQQMNLKYAHARRAPRKGDMGLAVALAGTAVLAGTAYADFHNYRAPQNSGGDGGGGGSCSSDSGSSCSSGCGGCGGGD